MEYKYRADVQTAMVQSRQTAEAMRSAVAEMDRLMETLAQIGFPAGEVCIRQYQELRPSVKKAEELMMAIAQQAQMAEEQYNKIDEDALADQFRD